MIPGQTPKIDLCVRGKIRCQRGQEEGFPIGEAGILSR